MARDIENRADIDLLMCEFYVKAMADDLIGHIFTDVARLDLDRHLPIIGDFWETLLSEPAITADTRETRFRYILNSTG